MLQYSTVPSSCVSIHEHCTVAEILVFSRETGIPTQYMYKSLQEMETNLIDIFKAAVDFVTR